MANQIDQDGVAILSALARAPRDTYVGGPELSQLTGLDPDRINDAVARLVDLGYAESIRTFGTAPYDFSEVTITSRGRYEHQGFSAHYGEISQGLLGTEPVALVTLPARPPAPVGSPYGFTDEDWEMVARQKAETRTVYVVFGYQFRSEHYETEALKTNVSHTFAQAVERFNEANPRARISLDFKPLAAGYGEHLFNNIARNIIGHRRVRGVGLEPKRYVGNGRCPHLGRAGASDKS